MPIDYKKYPKDWKQLRAVVLDRAGHRCELCHARDRTVIFRDDSGRWYNFRLNPCAKPIRIILTLHHINHDITDNRLINLIALCQRCHLRLDRPWKTRRFLN